MDAEHMKRVKKMLAYARDLAGRHNELVAQLERELTPPPAAHYDGEPCNLPVWNMSSKMLPKGKRLVYTGEYKVVKSKHYEWYELNWDKHGVYSCFGWCKNPQWILREEPIVPAIPKPEPKYKKEQWIVHEGVPEQITALTWNTKGYYIYETRGKYVGYYIESEIERPAVPSDWAKEFDGVLIWMEYLDNGDIVEVKLFKTSKSMYKKHISKWEADRNKAAGILTVPKEVCDGHQ